MCHSHGHDISFVVTVRCIARWDEHLQLTQSAIPLNAILFQEMVTIQQSKGQSEDPWCLQARKLVAHLEASFQKRSVTKLLDTRISAWRPKVMKRGDLCWLATINWYDFWCEVRNRIAWCRVSAWRLKLKKSIVCGLAKQEPSLLTLRISSARGQWSVCLAYQLYKCREWWNLVSWVHAQKNKICLAHMDQTFQERFEVGSLDALRNFVCLRQCTILRRQDFGTFDRFFLSKCCHDY